MTDTNNGIDAAAVIAGFFAEQTAQARAAAEKAEAAFAERQELPPAVGAMKQGWEMANWFTDRSSRIGYDVTNGKARIEQYQEAKAEREAVLVWLEANGYEVPGPYQ